VCLHVIGRHTCGQARRLNGNQDRFSESIAICLASSLFGMGIEGV
jgi:hypothetical protein